MKKSIQIVLVILIVMFFLFIFRDKKEENNLGINYTKENIMELNYKTKNPVVAMNIKNYGSIVIELYPTVAPITTKNFVKLTKNGFYDNNTFHRLVEGFVLQGGDPTAKGTGGSKDTIKGEFIENGVENNLKHEKGIISMARSNDMNSASSQFFIVLKESSFLDGKYAAFGKIIDGWNNIENIEENEEVINEILKTPLTITKAVVDLNDYKES